MNRRSSPVNGSRRTEESSSADRRAKTSFAPRTAEVRCPMKRVIQGDALECPVCAGLVPYEDAACPHCGSAIAAAVHSAMDETSPTPGPTDSGPPSEASATAIDDTTLGHYRATWPSSFFAVIVAGAVTIAIAFLVGPSPDADQFDDVVGNYLARNKVDVVTERSELPQSLPSPRTSAAIESANRSEPRAPLATRSARPERVRRARSTSPRSSLSRSRSSTVSRSACFAGRSR